MLASIDAEEIHEHAIRGAHFAARAAIAELDGSTDPTARAWTLAARAAMGSFVGGPTSIDALERVGELAEHAPRAAAFACAHLARISAAAFDVDLTRRIATVAQRLASSSDPVAVVVAGLTNAWSDWLTGELGAVDDASLAELERTARSEERAVLVIDAGILRALACEGREDVTAMLATARRVSRMARAEALPLPECVAHLVLARARRLSRRHHLSIRILGALRRVSPRALQGWIDWEAILAGDGETIERLGSSDELEGPWLPSRAAATSLAVTVAVARAGDLEAFDAAARTLTARSKAVEWTAREADEVLAAIDARRAPPPRLADWATTRTIDAPPSSHGLCVQVLEDAAEQAEAVLLAVPGHAARRVLGLGAKLLEAPGARVFQKTRRRQGRVETLIAVLLSAGAQGIDEGECFAATYELVYEADLHRGVFDVLVTRARAHLDGAGEIARTKGRMVLVHSEVLIVPDPRCAAPLHDRLLRIVARTGKASASDAARSTGLAIRTVQDALKALADEGVCELEREGRHLVYTVEDTTFSEATERFASEP